VTDWTKTTGSNGTMLIRDTGDVVEFWFKAGHESDWVNGLQFNYTVDGDTDPKTINYPTGADWYKVGSKTATYSQTVTFRLLSDTSISGIGGPTTFPHAVSRDTHPGAPSTPKISGIKATSVVVSFTDGSNGGDSIDARQITYGTSSSGGTDNLSSDGSTTVSGLNPNTTYYFWARCHNSEGWGPWSGRASAKTLSVPTAPSAPLLSSITATSVDVSWTENSNGGSSVTARQIGWGTSSTAPTSSVSANSPQVVNGLTPGTTYYIFVRVQNSVGWSAWSKPTSMRTVAGAYILVGSTWKLAVPYVRVSGTWKLAETWGRSAGVWKRTT
jgi:Fibronectin type III domain